MKASLGPSSAPRFGRATSQRTRPSGACRWALASSMTLPRRFLGIRLKAARHLLTTRGALRLSGPSPNADRRARRRPTQRTPRRVPRSTLRAAIPRGRPRIRSLSARRHPEARHGSPVPEPFHRSCELRRPDSEQRPRGEILEAASFSPRQFREFARSTSPPRGWTAFAQRAKSALASARFSLAGQRFGVELCPPGRERPRAFNSTAPSGGTGRRSFNWPLPRERRHALRRRERGPRCDLARVLSVWCPPSRWRMKPPNREKQRAQRRPTLGLSGTCAGPSPSGHQRMIEHRPAPEEHHARVAADSAAS